MTSTKPNTSPAARLCPLCGQSNQCQPAASGHFDVDCWCRDTRFSPAQLEKAHAISKERCICQRCALQLAKEISSP